MAKKQKKMMPHSSGLIDHGGGRYSVPKGTTQKELQRMLEGLDRNGRSPSSNRRRTSRRPPGYRWKKGGGIVEYGEGEEPSPPSPGRVVRIKGNQKEEDDGTS